MPIRLEHQPSPYAVGLAGYATGAGTRRQRQQKYALDLFQQDQAIRSRRDEQFQDRQFGLQLQDQRQDWMNERDARQQWSTPPSLSRIPDYVDVQTRRDLADKAAAIRDLRSKFSYDDQAAIQNERELREQYEDIIARQAPPSEAEAWNQGLTYIDEKTGRASDQPGEGLVPYRGGARAIDNSAEQAAAEKQRQAAEKTQKEARDKAEAERRVWDSDFATIAEKVREEHEDEPEWSPERIGGEAIRRMQIQGRGLRPDLPAAPAASPAIGASAGGGAVPEFDALPDATVAPVAPQSGAPGGGAVQDDGSIDLITSQPKDWAEEAWPDPINANGQPVSPNANPGMGASAESVRELFTDAFGRDASQYPRELQQRIRRTWEAGSPATRVAIEQRYGTMKPLDELYPDALQPTAAPLDTTARQHVEAMRGPQGTGERIPSDAARVAGQVQGAGSLAGRTAGYARRDAGMLGPGQTRTTKYNIAPTPAEREASMDERYARAVAERERKKASGEGAYSQTPTSNDAPMSPETMKQYREVMGQSRKDEMQRRKANLQASKIHITTEAEYDRLRPGTYFTGPDGKIRRKP